MNSPLFIHRNTLVLEGDNRTIASDKMDGILAALWLLCRTQMLKIANPACEIERLNAIPRNSTVL
jgi:hypothetical protein